MSQNTCARTDIILKRGSRARRKEQHTSSHTNEQRQQPEVPSLPPLPPVPSSASMMMGLKQEDRSLSVRLLNKRTSSFKFCHFRKYLFHMRKDRHYSIRPVHRHHFRPSILIMIHY